YFFQYYFNYNNKGDTMKKMNSTTMLLMLGVVLSFFCSYFLGNILLGVILFIAILGFVIFTKRAVFFSSKANIAYQKKEIEKSFELYEKAIAFANCPTMVRIVYAYRLISEGNVAKSSQILSTLDPMGMNENEKFNYNATHAIIVWKQGSLHRAIEIFEALLNDKESLLIYETLGYLILCSRNYQKALNFNLKALEFNDTSQIVRDNLAGSYYYLGYHKKAAKIYKSLIEENVNFPEPYYYYALILNEREKYKSALKYLGMALEKKESKLSELTHQEIQYMIDEINRYLAEESVFESEFIDSETTEWAEVVEDTSSTALDSTSIESEDGLNSSEDEVLA
ncbi:MAG: tetratricopeptide repeat protein, partial [Cellulosilyticaceae bacterium]